MESRDAGGYNGCLVTDESKLAVGHSFKFRKYQGTLREYEIVWILGGGADEKEGRESADKMRQLVDSLGGNVTAVKPWGKRTLSYQIGNDTEGFYVETQFSMDPSKANEFAQAVTADRGIIRHLIVKK